VSSGALTQRERDLGHRGAVTISGGELNFNTVSPVTLPSLVLSGGTLGGTARDDQRCLRHHELQHAGGTGTLTTQGISTVNMRGAGAATSASLAVSTGSTKAR